MQDDICEELLGRHKLPLHFSLPDFLDFFAFLTFSLSASLSPEYSSKLLKLLLCCSSQDDGNAVGASYMQKGSEIEFSSLAEEI